MSSELTDLIGALISNADFLAPTAPKETEFPKREDRAPYPPGPHPELLPPIKPEEMARKRHEADREFWDLI